MSTGTTACNSQLTELHCHWTSEKKYRVHKVWGSDGGDSVRFEVLMEVTA
jgi:hypothetical protein